MYNLKIINKQENKGTFKNYLYYMYLLWKRRVFHRQGWTRIENDDYYYSSRNSTGGEYFFIKKTLQLLYKIFPYYFLI